MCPAARRSHNIKKYFHPSPQQLPAATLQPTPRTPANLKSPMTSVAQLNANRLNAQRSTGPRTEAGKANSRFNALTYGLEARSRVIPGEDPAQFESLAAAYHSQFNPVGPLEDFLVESIVAADWNRRRYTLIEAQLYRALMSAARRRLDAPKNPDSLSELAAVFGDDVIGAKILQSAFRQLASAERSAFCWIWGSSLATTCPAASLSPT